jgi:hypothetical protein
MCGTQFEAEDAAWIALYRAGGAAALTAAIVFRRNLGAELMLLRMLGLIHVGPATAPRSALDWFALLQDNKLLGLALFDLCDLINYALVGLVFLALYGALRRTNQSTSLIATAFCFVGIAVYMASNQAFSMLALSERYAAATSDVQRATFLAAGEALLAIHNPGDIYRGTGIYASLMLVLLAGLIVSIAMLRSTVFSKVTAWMGIVANGLGLGQFLALALVPAILALPPSLSAPFRLAWYILIAIRLFQLSRVAEGERSSP